MKRLSRGRSLRWADRAAPALDDPGAIHRADGDGEGLGERANFWRDAGREREDVRRGDGQVLLQAARLGDAHEAELRAGGRLAAQAGSAGTAGDGWLDGNSGAGREAISRLDEAGDLVPGDHSGEAPKLAAIEVEVGAADADGAGTDEHLAGGGLRNRAFDDVEGVGVVPGGGSHRRLSYPSGSRDEPDAGTLCSWATARTANANAVTSSRANCNGAMRRK